MPRPMHFEIPANNPERAMDFYARALGWKFTKWDGPVEYWVIETGNASEPGINGGLMRKRHPDQPCVNTVAVENIDRTIQSIESSGGTMVVAKMPVPGVGWLAYCKDTEGYIFGVMQPDSSAK
jgi:uncharacterized protein